MPATPRGRLVAVALLVLLPLLAAAPATAHSALVGSTPEPGSTITALPDAVELRFNETLSDISPAVIVRRDGETVAPLAPRVDGTLLAADAPTDLPDGDYTLVWRVVSGDGHPIDGVVPFTISGAGVEAAASAPTERTAPEAQRGSAAIVLAVAAPAALLLAGLVWLLRRRTASPTSKDIA